jgi:two-component system response regulator HydG
MSPDPAPHILVVDDDPGHLTALKTIIKSWGYRVDGVDDGAAAVERVRETPYDLVLMDVRMAHMSGLEALKRIRGYNPAIPVLIMTAYSSVATAVEALKAGAYDYLTKPLDYEVLKLGIERARDHSGLKSENQALKAELRAAFDLQNIVGKSPAMVELIDMVAQVAPSEATVLITGESGTGKELIARALHVNSGRRDKPFVVVNCAALTETLLESELFGHERGAFTGADRRREGRFMQAHQGTVFLDEIGEMSPSMQARLLRVIQEREIQRVGGTEVLEVDVRILAATHRDLAAEVAAGRFREDLFYRLNVVALKVPPLRARRDDIPLLAAHFLARYAARNRKAVRGFAPRAMDLLLRHGWPGNVRELENAVERAVILLAGDYVSAKELPLSITAAPGAAPAGDPPAAVPDGGRTLQDIERDAILATLQLTEGNKSKAAEKLGITRKTLYKKLKTYGEE